MAITDFCKNQNTSIHKIQSQSTLSQVQNINIGNSKMVITGTGCLGAWALISNQTHKHLRLSKWGLTMVVITTTGCLL